MVARNSKLIKFAENNKEKKSLSTTIVQRCLQHSRIKEREKERRKPKCRVHTKSDGAAQLHTKSTYRRIPGDRRLERYALKLRESDERCLRHSPNLFKLDGLKRTPWKSFNSEQKSCPTFPADGGRGKGHNVPFRG